jgi:hypothetical protein
MPPMIGWLFDRLDFCEAYLGNNLEYVCSQGGRVVARRIHY